MTTINIYENKSGEDSILQKDYSKEFDELKELLNQVLKENKNLKKMILDLKYGKKETNESKKVADTVRDALKELGQIEKDKVQTVTLTTNNANKVEKKSKFSEKELKNYKSLIMGKLQGFNKEGAMNYTRNLQRQYKNASASERKSLLKDIYTVNDMMEDTGLSRYDLETYVLKSLINEKRIDCFRINPSKEKSLIVYYRLEKFSRKRLNDNDKFEIVSSSAKSLYENLELLSDGSLKYTNRNKTREFILDFDIYDILFVKSVSDKSNFSMGDFKKLHTEHEWEREKVYRLIHNIRENPVLKKIIGTAKNVFVTNKDFDKQNNILTINGSVTHIPIHQAKSWCDAYINNGKDKDVFIWELQKRFPEINRDCIAILLYNVSNNELHDVLKEDKKDVGDFVENNPSKRRNLIMNGGLI